MQIMVLQILQKVNHSIRHSLCFSIMADECNDVANKEQFSICIRWVSDNLQDHEDFIGLYEVGSIDTDCLVHAIRDTLLRMKLELAEEKRAVYTHCYGHVLNLAIGDTIKL